MRFEYEPVSEPLRIYAWIYIERGRDKERERERERDRNRDREVDAFLFGRCERRQARFGEP